MAILEKTGCNSQLRKISTDLPRARSIVFMPRHSASPSPWHGRFAGCGPRRALRRLRAGAHVIARRPATELLLEFVSGPAGSVAAFVGDRHQLAAPAQHFGTGANLGSYAPATVHVAEFAIGHVDRRCLGLWSRSAFAARAAFEPDGRTPGRSSALAHDTGRANCGLDSRHAILCEGPIDRLLDEAVLKDRAGVVEDQCVGFPGRRPQHSADHPLPIQAHALGRSREHQATHLGLVPALRQHHAVDDNLDAAVRQPRQDRIALLDRRRTVQVLRPYAARSEFVPKMHRMCDTACEYDRTATLGQSMPMRDDVADKLLIVHPVGELLLDVIPALDARRRTNPAATAHPDPNRNEMAAGDQFGDGRALNNGLEDVSYPRPSPRQGVAVMPRMTADG